MRVKKTENGFVVSKVSPKGLEKTILRFEKSNMIKTLLCFLFGLSTLFSDLTPFGLAFYSAIFSVKWWGAYLFFSIISTLFSSSYNKLVYVLSYIVLTFVFALFEKQTKNYIIRSICTLLVFLTFGIVSSLTKPYLTYRILKIILEGMFLFIGVLMFSLSKQSLTYIGKREYLSQKEVISLCFSYALLLLSFNAFLRSDYFSIPLFIGILSILIMCYTKDTTLSIILSVALSIVLSLGDKNLFGISFSFPFGALLCVLLKNYQKAGISFGFTLSVCFSSLFMPIDEELIVSIYETLMACLVFAFIPQKTLDTLSSFFGKANLTKSLKKRSDQNLEFYAERLNFIGNSIDDLSSYYKNSPCDTMEKREVQNLMASQLDAISKTIKKESVNILSQRHEEKEDTLWASLDKNDIHPKRIYINSQNANLYITISLKDIDFKKDTKESICAIIYEVLGVRCEYASVKRLNDEYVLLFCKESAFKATFGYATKIKTGEKVSGDSFNVIYSGKNKMIMVLSDAMGSGEKAHIQSKNAVSLFEKFINSGFNTDLALKILNSSFILKNENESFSTIDLCDIDLENNTLKFSKNGGASAYIKSGGKVTKITSESLPIGIVKEAKAQKFSLPIVSDSVIVLVSDGVTDIELRDKSKENFIQNELLKINSSNAQIIASKLLKEAFKISGDNAKDDMTVLVCNISKKEKEV